MNKSHSSIAFKMLVIMGLPLIEKSSHDVMFTSLDTSLISAIALIMCSELLLEYA